MVSASLDRLIGEYSTGEDGPLFVITGGMHGNEPAGVQALERVFSYLHEHQIPIRGRLIGFKGNVDALDQKQRFVDRDLNRNWTPEYLSGLRSTPHSSMSPEDRNQRELLMIIDGLLANAKEPIAFLDLHSTSSHGIPFCVMADTLRNRRIAFAFKVPVILGLEEIISDAMLGYLSELGHIALAIEGGQHDAPDTVDNLESAIWLALRAHGNIGEYFIPDLAEHRKRLEELAADAPRVVEVLYRHYCAPEDDFHMRPGYTSFQPVAADELLAHDQSGEIRAERRGVMLMPKYQGQGEDGFFISRRISTFWLWASMRLREARAERLLPLLPGINQREEEPDILDVDTRIARWLPNQILHLFGFRRVRKSGEVMTFSRRRADFRPLVRKGLDKGKTNFHLRREIKEIA